MAATRELSVGDTLSLAMDMMGRNFLGLGGCLAIGTILSVVTQGVTAAVFNGGFNDGGESSPLGAVAASVVSLAFAAFNSGVNGHAAEVELRRQKATFSSGWLAGWRNLLPQLGVVILLGLMLIVGFTLFIIPGLIVLTLFGAAPTAQVAERSGVFAAFGHSLRAGKGQRLRLLGYYVVAWIVALIALMIIYFLVAAVAFGAITAVGTSTGGQPPFAFLAGLGILAIPVVVFFAAAIPLAFGTIPAAAYATLASDRSEQSVGSVFD